MSGERNKTAQARLTDEEFEFVEERAKKFGISISNYVRLVLLNANIEVNVKIGKIEED